MRRRVADLGLAHAVFGAGDKLAAAQGLLGELGLGWSTVAAMGDDWPDLPLLTRAAFACARRLRRTPRCAPAATT